MSISFLSGIFFFLIRENVRAWVLHVDYVRTFYVYGELLRLCVLVLVRMCEGPRGVSVRLWALIRIMKITFEFRVPPVSQ